MKSNSNAVVFLLVALAGGLLVGLIGGLAVGFMIAKTPVAVPPAEQGTEVNVEESPTCVKVDVKESPSDDSHPLDGKEKIDFGGGVVFKRSTSRTKLSNGQPKTQMDSFFLKGERIWTTMLERGPKYKNGYTMSISFWKDNTPVLSEIDEDGDGIFEQLIFSDYSGPRQVFDLAPDGQILQANKKKLAELQKAYQFGMETLAPIAEGAQQKLPKKEIRRRVEEAFKKAKDYKSSIDDE